MLLQIIAGLWLPANMALAVWLLFRSRSSVGSEQRPSKPLVAGSSPAGNAISTTPN